MIEITPNESRALEITNTELNRLRGKLFEVVEAVGLPDKQEEAVKRLIRRTSYDSQNLISSALRGDYIGNGGRC